MPGKVVGYEMWVVCPNCGFNNSVSEASEEETIDCAFNGCDTEIEVAVKEHQPDQNP